MALSFGKNEVLKYIVYKQLHNANANANYLILLLLVPSDLSETMF